LALGAAAHAYRQRSEHDSVRKLRDDEVAVVYDALRGEVRSVEGPGKLVELPVFHELRVMRRSPVPMHFTGTERPDPFRVPAVHLRTADGSPMRFDDFTLRYGLLPERARQCLEDTQAILSRAARLVEVNARSVLIERFGRHSSEQVVKHEVLVEETANCRRLLDLALEPHGLQVIEFSTSKPRFDAVYEDAVERRKVSIAEIERLRARADGLPAELEEQLAKLEQQKQAERDSILMETSSELAKAQRVALLARTNAELYAAELLRRGETELLQLQQAADLFAMEQRTEAEGRRAEVRRVAALGRTAILEAWIARLGDLRFRVEPPRTNESTDATETVAQRR
jgi:SPFH domain/Band 7 family protein